MGRGGTTKSYSLSCVIVEKSPRFLLSQALKVKLSKEHCSCAFVFGSLRVVGAYHLETNCCISIVCIHQAGGGPRRRGPERLSLYSRKSFMHSGCSSPVPSTLKCFSPTRVASVFTLKRSSHDCGLLVFCRYMTSTRCYRSPSILSGPNCTPEASYLIHS